MAPACRREGPVDLGLLDQQRRGGEEVDIADMIAVGLRDRHEGDVGRLQLQLAKLRGQRPCPGRLAHRRGDGPVRDRIGIAGVPQEPLCAVMDEVAAVRELDRLSDIDARRPTRLVRCRIVPAIHHVESVHHLRHGGRGIGYHDRASNKHPVEAHESLRSPLPQASEALVYGGFTFAGSAGRRASGAPHESRGRSREAD